MSKIDFPLSVKAIIIDLDGTLLDTAPDLAVAANRMLAELGREPLPEARIADFIGKGVPHLVKRTLTESYGNEPDEALFERALESQYTHYDRTNGELTQPYPGVMEGLALLQQAGFKLACVTNKFARFTLPLLKQMKMDTYFSETISGDTLPRKKPDPLPLTHTAKQFGIAPAQMLMIGDSFNDVQAARAAGCPIFCVDYGYNEGLDVRTFGVDAIVSSLVEAHQLIKNS
jgi:phosphoglycolate phosphatase